MTGLNPKAVPFVPGGGGTSSPSASPPSTNRRPASPPAQQASSPGMEPHKSQPFILVLIGAPGSGKSTQGRILSKHYGFNHLAVGDALRERRKTDPELDRNFTMAYCSKISNEMLDDAVREVVQQDLPGLVLEYVKTPAGSEMVNQTCKKYLIKVGLTVLLEIDDIPKLLGRILKRGKAGSNRREDTPAAAMQRIHEYMYTHQKFKHYYKGDTTFCVVPAGGDAVEVAAFLTVLIDGIRQQASMPLDTAIVPSFGNETNPSSLPPLPGTFFNQAPGYLQFIPTLTETAAVLMKLAQLLDTDKVVRFPGTHVTPMDEPSVDRVCGLGAKEYFVSKKIDGTRYLLLHVGDKTYLIDRSLMVYTISIYPAFPLCGGSFNTGGTYNGPGLEAPTNNNMILLDGEFVTIGAGGGRAVFMVFDVLYAWGYSTLSKTLEIRLEHLHTLPNESVLEQQPPQIEPSIVLLVQKKYCTMAELPRLLSEFEKEEQQLSSPVYHTDGLVFTSRKLPYKSGIDKNLYVWKPPSRATFDFRLEQTPPQYLPAATNPTPNPADTVAWQLNVATHDKREVFFAPLHPQHQLPQFSAAHLSQWKKCVVECRPLDLNIKNRKTDKKWQICRVRNDKPTPNNKEAVLRTLGQGVTANTVLEIYNQLTNQQQQQQQDKHSHPHSGAQAPFFNSAPSANFRERGDASPFFGGGGRGSPPAHPNPRGWGGGWENGETFEDGRSGFGARSPWQDNFGRGQNQPVHQHVISTNEWHHTTGDPQTPPRRWAPKERDERIRDEAMEVPTPASYQHPHGNMGHIASSSTPPSLADPTSFSPKTPPPASPPQHGRWATPPGTPSPTYSLHCVPPVQQFVTTVKEWVIRKLVPPASAARPRPYSVLHLWSHDGDDLYKWDKYRAAYVLSVHDNERTLRDAKHNFAPDASMKTETGIVTTPKGKPGGFELPVGTSVDYFEVIASFFSIHNVCSSRETMSNFLQSVEKHLKPGGIFILTTTDSDAINTKVNAADVIACSEFKMQLVKDETGTQRPNANQFGQSLMLDVSSTAVWIGESQQYTVPAAELVSLAAGCGLVEDLSGSMNFSTVAKALKNRTHISQWTRLSDGDQTFAECLRTFAFRKPGV